MHRSRLTYDGIETLKGWIQAVDEEYGGAEKRFIDELLGVPENSGVIDLEMGLPAWDENGESSSHGSVSIDRVRGGAFTVFFGEVKLVTDQRLRCRAPVEPDVMPEVLRQLGVYRNYLGAPARQKQVSEEYSNAARVLRELASVVKPERFLGEHILGAAVAVKPLDVAERPCLIVMNDKNDKNVNQRAWSAHKAKLESERERVQARSKCWNCLSPLP